MELQIDPASREPIYQQIVEQVREGIARGRYRPGERLPSVRDLSRRLVINPNTVARAYVELEQTGLIVGRQGLGYFVAELKNDLTLKVRRERLREQIDRLLTEAVHLGFNAEDMIRLLEDRAREFQRQPATKPKPESSRER